MPYVPSHELQCNYILIAIASIFLGMYWGQPRQTDLCKPGYHLNTLKTLESNPSIESILNSPQPPYDVEYKGPESYSMVCTRDEEY